MLLLMMPALAYAAPADCPAAATVSHLQGKLDAAEADAQATAENIGQLVSETMDAVPCLSELAPPSLAAQLHRVAGMRAALNDEFAGLPAFMAARAIEPDAPLLPGGALADTPIGEAYGSVDLARIQWDELPEAAGGTLRSDGGIPARRAADLPVLLQLEGPDGVLWTRYLAPGDAVPDYALAAPPDAGRAAAEPALAAPEPLPLPPAPKKRQTHAALRWGGLGTALAGGVVYGLAAMELQDYHDIQRPTQTQFDDYQGRVNGMSAGGVAGMALGAGLFGLSFAVGG